MQRNCRLHGRRGQASGQRHGGEIVLRLLLQPPSAATGTRTWTSGPSPVARRQESSHPSQPDLRQRGQCRRRPQLDQCPERGTGRQFAAQPQDRHRGRPHAGDRPARSGIA